jgi:ATP-dependent Lon protease
MSTAYPTNNLNTGNVPVNNPNQVELEFPEIQALMEQINSSGIPQELKDRLLMMSGRLKIAARVGGYSTEFEGIKRYVDWLVRIPWSSYTQDFLDLKKVSDTLNAHHYGLEDVKNSILDYLAMIKLSQINAEKAIAKENADVEVAQSAEVQSMESQTTVAQQVATIPVAAVQAAGGVEASQVPGQPSVQASGQSSMQTTESQILAMKKLRSSSENAPILCFVGVQGVGKTTMAKSIAEALGRKFIRISLGAMASAEELRGRSRAEKDAEPGQVVKALVNTGVMNPLILLDEIDKVSSESGLRADVMATLLEVLDPEQNASFVDRYIDFPVDLSQVIFITTSNNLGGISTALLDRLEVIRFSSYSPDEKKVIAKNYLLPKVRKAAGLTEEQLIFTDDVWDVIIKPLGFDSGIRQLERNLMKIARKSARRIIDGLTTSVTISQQNFREFLPQDIDVYS